MIDAYLTEGTERAFGPSLHIEGNGNSLILSGWWHAALRIAQGVYAVRNEEPREEAPALAELVAALREKGLAQVAVDHPLIQPITYTEISLGQVSWALWATDLARTSRPGGAQPPFLGEPVSGVRRPRAPPHATRTLPPAATQARGVPTSSRAPQASDATLHQVRYGYAGACGLDHANPAEAYWIDGPRPPAQPGSRIA